jgi:hypothetical protein
MFRVDSGESQGSKKNERNGMENLVNERTTFPDKKEAT